MNHIIFGGAFDPIHNGHINMALFASKSLNADVFFVVSRISVWKHTSAAIEDKINMINLAIKDYPEFKLDLFEVNSGKIYNYSIDTVKYFKSKYPNDKLFYLIGADQVEEFHRWKSAKELSELCQIIFFKRHNHDLYSDNVITYNMQMIEGPTIDVNSSSVRDGNALNTPFPVIKYIEEHELYYMSYLKAILKEKRYNHSVSVANLCYEIAVANNYSEPLKAYLAGLFHDCGKYQCEPIVDEKEAIKGFEDLSAPLQHQIIGAVVANKIFKITDKSILSAIKYHATGKSNMSKLEKIVYAADKIDPLRGYDSKEYIQAMKHDISSGFIIVLAANKIFLETKNKDIHNRLTDECFKYYLKMR